MNGLPYEQASVDEPCQYTIGSRNGTGPSSAAASSDDDRDTMRMLTFGAASQRELPVASSAVASKTNARMFIAVVVDNAAFLWRAT